MARLEVKIEGNSTGLTRSLDQVDKSLDKSTARTKALQKAVAEWDAAARRNAQNNPLAVSLAKQSGIIKLTANEVKNLSKQYTLLSKTKFSFGLGDNRNLLNSLKEVKEETDKSSDALIRHVYAQRTALSAANNLSKGITALAIGQGNAAVNAGVMIRQLATLGTLGGAGITSLVSAFLGPGGLIIALSAAATALTGYVAKKIDAQKETNRLRNSTEDYIATLKGVERASADGQVAAQKDLTNLRLMYEATQNLSIPMEKRRKIAQKLIDQYPEQLKGLSTEEILAGKAAEAYDKLAVSITKTATAAAYANKITENSAKQLENYLQILDRQSEVNKLNQQIERERALAERNTSAAGSAGTGASSAAQYGAVARLEAKRNEALKQINNLGRENSEITKENSLLQSNYNKMIVEGGEKLKDIKDTSSEINSLMDSLQGTLLSQLDKKVFDIDNKYRSIFETIKKIGDESRRADAFGLATQAKQLEMLRADTERFIYMIGNMKPAGAGVSLSTTITMTEDLPGLKQAGEKINRAIISGISSEGVSKSVQRSMTRGFVRGVESIIDNIDDLGSNFYEVFSNVISSLAGTAQKTFQRALLNSIGEQLTEKFKKGFQIGNLSRDVSNAIVAGAGIAGQVLGSSVFKPTSTGGQAVAGGVTGAASGFAIGASIGGVGGPLGAIAGGIIGAIGGIFGAKSAKKREELAQQQLEEQRKQTRLMERQNALGYLSNIIGQMTTSGIVTGADRDAFGNLYAEVAGDKIRFVFGRSEGNNRRF